MEATEKGDHLTAPVQLPPGVRAMLRAHVARRRRGEVARAAGLGLAFGVLWILGWALVDRVWAMAGWVRLGILIIGAVVMLRLVVRAIWAWMRGGIDWVGAAREVESSDGTFHEKLETVTSQMLLPADRRGSGELLGVLMDEVEDAARKWDGKASISLHPIRRAWGVAGAGLVVGMGMMFLPWLDLPRLLHRLAMPLADVPAVTTTELSVSPGDVEVFSGQNVVVTVQAEGLGGRGVTIDQSDDRERWSASLMSPGGEGRFVHVLAGLERDRWYSVSGGDARSRVFRVSVLRPPAVREFRVRYVYPSYIGREPLVSIGTEGIIEAPAGTTAEIEIEATEPLREAILRIGEKPLIMSPGSGPNVRQATLLVENDATFALEMTSIRGATGRGPASMAIRAVKDQPPLVQMVDPRGDMRVTGHETVYVRLEAIDDFGVASMQLRVGVNEESPREYPVPIEGDPRRQDRLCVLEVGELNLRVGDVVSYAVELKDGLGQTSQSEERHLLIAPQSVDVDARMLLVELREAMMLAGTIVSELEAARSAHESLRRHKDQSREASVAMLEMERTLVGSAESAAMLRRTMIATAGRDASDQMAPALEQWADFSQRVESTSSVVGEGAEGGARSDAATRQITLLLQEAKRRRDELRIVFEGERAAVVRAEQANVNAVSERKDVPALIEQILKRAQDELAIRAGEMGLNLQAGNLNAELDRRIVEGRAVLVSQKPVDFVDVARTWHRESGRSKDVPTFFQERLRSAAYVEANRKSGDPLRARDLLLSAQAAERFDRLAISGTENQQDLNRERAGYPDALAALRRLHDLHRKQPGDANDAEKQRISSEAAQAREHMLKWARSETDRPATTQRSEEMAITGNAHLNERDYAAVDMADAYLMGSVPEGHRRGMILRARELTETARRIDEIAEEQKKLSAETEVAKQGDAPALAERQGKVADEIQSVEQRATGLLKPSARLNRSDMREESIATMRMMKERVAAMPRTLAAIKEAAEARRQAAQRDETARQALQVASPDQKPAAERLAEQAAQQLKSAELRLIEVSVPVSTLAIGEMAAALQRFLPETEEPMRAIERDLAPALAGVRAAMESGKAESLEHASAVARTAMNNLQIALRRGQMELIERDPMVAARWFARTAAEGLRDRPTDLPTVREDQGNVSLSLDQAWSGTVRESTNNRTRAAWGLPMMNFPGWWEGNETKDAMTGSGVREWGTLRPRESADSETGIDENIPAGYQEQIKAYFEALGKLKE